MDKNDIKEINEEFPEKIESKNVENNEELPNLNINDIFISKNQNKNENEFSKCFSLNRVRGISFETIL